MKLILSTHNVTLTKAIEDHIMDRIWKLEHLDRFAINARVTLDHDKTKAPERQFSCSMRLEVPGPDLFAEDVVRMAPMQPLLVDGGITHPSVLARVLPVERICCLEVEPGASAKAWAEHPDRAEMREAVLRTGDSARSWATFLAFDEQINSTLARESRELGISLLRRTAGTRWPDKKISFARRTMIISPIVRWKSAHTKISISRPRASRTGS